MLITQFSTIILKTRADFRKLLILIFVNFHLLVFLLKGKMFVVLINGHSVEYCGGHVDNSLSDVHFDCVQGNLKANSIAKIRKPLWLEDHKNLPMFFEGIKWNETI